MIQVNLMIIFPRGGATKQTARIWKKFQKKEGVGIEKILNFELGIFKT